MKENDGLSYFNKAQRSVSCKLDFYMTVNYVVRPVKCVKKKLKILLWTKNIIDKLKLLRSRDVRDNGN